MNVWAISDLHLSFGRPERRDQYAARWRDHADKIARGWREVVRPSDIVLLPGDLSMARNHREVQPDLAWLARLPGTKVLSAGNHDLWWNRVEAVRPLLRAGMLAVGGDAVRTHGVIVCGARGAPVRSEGQPESADARLASELEQLDRALEQAQRLRGEDEPVCVLWHFPLFDAEGTAGPCVERLEAARVAVCLYGHIHTEGQWTTAVQGPFDGVCYHCVAADAIGFRPLQINALHV